MKKLIFSLILILTQVFTFDAGFAQTQKSKAREIEAIKIGYITRRLELTPEESQKFWPIYNQYQKELSLLNQQKRQARSQNEASPEKLVDDDFNFDTKVLDLKKKYRLRYAEALSAEKVKRLYVAERDFREELIKQLRERRENQN
jgi:Spy/CpxP family protein refolding chaperone